MVNSKSWYASKTIWVAIVTAGAGILMSLTGTTISSAEMTTVLGFIFIILRLVTNNQIDLGDNGSTVSPQ